MTSSTTTYSKRMIDLPSLSQKSAPLNQKDHLLTLLDGEVEKETTYSDILTYPNDTLNKVSKKSNQTRGEYIVKQLDMALFDELTKQYTGYGLAAPQIGMLERVCIIRYGGMKLDLINPEIVSRSSMQITHREYCLSLPNKSFMVRRSAGITVKADSLERELVVDDMELSRIIQHEIDHLDGKLICDISISNNNKIGRNKTCPCGSGKKYKKCCLNKE